MIARLLQIDIKDLLERVFNSEGRILYKEL